MFLAAGIRPPTQPQAPVFPLKRAAGVWHLVDQLNRPFLFCGDSPWEIATTLTLAQATLYADNALARGVTSVLVQCCDNQFNFGNTVSSSTWGPNSNGDMPFTTKQGGGSYTDASAQLADFSTPNTAYWNFLDSVLNLFVARNIHVFLYPIWLGNPIPGNPPTTEGYYSALAAQSSGIRQAYGAFVGNRYRLGGSNPIPGLIYVVGGDNSVANGASIPAICEDIVTGIQSVDTGHLFSCDQLDGDSPLTQTTGWTPGATFVQNGVNNVYTDQPAGHPYTYVNCKAEYQRSDFPLVPYFQKEGVYENAGSAAQVVRSQTWTALLGGACGYHWGRNGVWQFSSGWQSNLATRGALDHQVVNQFFNSRRWDLLVPDWGNAFLTNGASYTNANFAAAALAFDGSWAAIYVPTTESLTVATSSLVLSGTKWYWLDPTTRATQQLGSFSGSHSFTPPTANAQGDADWVLVGEVPGRNVWV